VVPSGHRPDGGDSEWPSGVARQQTGDDQVGGRGWNARARASVKAVAVSVIGALIAAAVSITIPTAAAAADDGITEIVETLNGASNSVQAWTQTLGEIGKLADSLPGVPASPGSILGFDDLLQEIFSDADGIATAAEDGDLDFGTRDLDLGQGRTATIASDLETLEGGDKQVTLTITASKTAPDQPMTIPLPIGEGSSAPQSAFSSTGGVDLTVDASFALRLVWDSTDHDVFLVADGTYPRIAIDATASITDMAGIEAAIGILGVDVVDPSSLTLDAHFESTVSDPNNDGELAFVDALGGQGELAQADSLSGLVDFGFADQAGSLAAALTLEAAPSAGLSLPAIEAGITVSWPDISEGSPAIEATGIDAVGKFLNMTPRDLADGIGQLVTSLTSMQRAHIGNLQLPFVKGSLADAARISEVLAEFLTENITTAEEDPALAGTPDFVSLQGFFEAINAADIDIDGGQLSVGDVHWVDADSKLDFRLALSREAADAVPLNAAGAAASGGPDAVFGTDTLTDTSQDWEPGAFVGHRVVAGTSAGTVASNTASTITLEDPWTPIQPADGSAYTVSAMQGDVGTVQLGDSLKTGTGDAARGVEAANAVNATAMVTPSYAAEVTLVLDLQPPEFNDPPVEITNPDGTKIVTPYTPIGANRVLLRTDGGPELFTADFPIDAGIDIFANAGFFQVRLEGDLGIDAADDADPMVTVRLKDHDDLTFGQVVAMLVDDPTELLEFDVNVGAAGSVDVSVPGASDFLQGGTAGASFTWNDLTQTSGEDGPQFDVDDLSELVDLDFDASNPKALFSIILKTLQTLRTALQDSDPTTPGAEVFNTEIPVLGRSLSDLLQSDESGGGPNVTYGEDTLTDASRNDDDGSSFSPSLVGRSIIAGTQIGVVESVTDTTLTMASDWTSTPATGTPYTMRTELDDAISLLEGDPSDNIQELVRQLDERLAGTPLDFAYEEIDGVPSVVLRLTWERGYHTSAPVQFDFDLGGDALSLAGVQGQGNVALGVDGAVDVGLVIPLGGDGPAGIDELKILEDSSIGVAVDASIDDAFLKTNLGPLSLSLGDPDEGATDRASATASYSVDLGVEGAGDGAVTFSEFLGNVGADINDSSEAVTCDGLDEGTEDLALCAHLPLYFDAGGGSHEQLIPGDDNAFNVRLPKDGDNVTELFAFTGQVGGEDRFETPDPTLLADAIANALINFTDLGSIDSYLQLIEQALNAASFGGKLPLVGEDLQQGADFIGELRTAFQSALGDATVNADMGSTAAVRAWVDDKLKTALGTNNPANVSLVFECPALQSPGNFAATPTTAGGGTTYRYQIVSYQTLADGTTKQETVPLGTSATDGPLVVDADNTINLSWETVEYAHGYRIFRELTPGSYRLVAEVPQSQSTYEDSTLDADLLADAPENPAENPMALDCDYADVDGIKISLDVSQGTFGGDGLLDCDTATAPHECVTESVPLDIGIPGLSLKGRDGQGPGVELGYRLHVGFGINKDDGFFIDAGTDADPAELSLGLNFTLPDEIDAELAFINITARNCTSAPEDTDEDAPNCTDSAAPGDAPPAFGGAFHINVDDGADNDGHLTIAELSGASFDSLFNVKLQADAEIDWLLKATVGDETAGFPGIQAQLKLEWHWSNEAPDITLPTVGFYNVAIDAGEVFGQILGPIVNKIKAVTNPLDPIIKTLYAPIPVLSDLSRLAGGDDVTLVTLAKTFNTLADGPDLTFVETIIGVVDFINNLPECTSTCLIPIGSFALDPGKAVNTTATPDNTESLINPASKALNTGVQGDGGAIGALNTKSSTGGDLGVKGSGTPSAKAGFSFPVFEEPASLFNVILGGDVDLVKFDSGDLTLGFDWRQSFGPVYAPPPVFITLHGSASVTLRIVAGFDTYGIRQAFEEARAGELGLDTLGNVFLQSLFFYTTEDGKPLPVVTFRGEIAAGAEVSAIIIKVGIEGGVGLSVSFLWNDPTNDGKFRISEFLQAALNNPICLFTVSGRVYVFLRAYVTIGFSPFEVSFSFTIVDVTLLDFSAAPDCEPPPPELGGVHEDATNGHTLVVYAANQDDARGPDYVDQESESIKITSLHEYEEDGDIVPAGVAVNMLGIRREYRNPDIKRVIVDGRGYAGKMKVTFLGDGKPIVNGDLDDSENPPTASFDLDAIVFGGTNDDVIKTGIGNSWVDGGDGNDVIVTGDRTVLKPGGSDYVRSDASAYVAGGPGDDSISVGNGNNTVAGDDQIEYGPAPLPTKELVNDEREGGDPVDGNDGMKPDSDGEAGPTVHVPDWTTFSGVDENEDTAADDGDGVDGIDTVKAGLGDTTLYGNGGRDTLGIATDSPLADTRPGKEALFESQGATLIGGTGDDSFAGGEHDDTIITGPDAGGLDDDPDADGGADDGSRNTVDTGTGSDTVYGSTGEDFVIGHSFFEETDNIRGGAANDVLVGGYGADTVFGGPGDDYVLAEPTKVGEAGVDDGYGPSRSLEHQPLPDGVDPNFKVLVGGTGNDHIVGGDGGADIDGDAHNPEHRCGPGDPVASDPVGEGVNVDADGNDRIIGGAGVENVRAGGGNDLAEVAGADDELCGEKGVDTLRGGADDDDAWGGSGDDVLDGDAGADDLYGNDGADTIYGDAGVDDIEGNGGVDWASGGDGDDVILGGTRAEDRGDVGDHLYGDLGFDTIIGDNGGLVGSRQYPYDLDGASPLAGGGDRLYGGAQDDKLYGALADDVVFGGGGDDQIEGNNASDTIRGEGEHDNIIGGSSEVVSGTGLDRVGRPDGGDVIHGDGGSDAITGDNAIVVDAGPGHEVMRGRGIKTRDVALLDLGYSPKPLTSGQDVIDGDDGVDIVFAQGDVDTVHGGAGDDYLEGGQAGDTINGNAGQDDIVGGGSTIQSGEDQAAAGQHDGGDVITGGTAGDVVLGDNGIIRRDTTPGAASILVRARGLVLRTMRLYDLGDSPVFGTSGGDLVLGNDESDVILGQSGDDRLKGGAHQDYVEGGPGRDWIEGNDDADDLVGGSSTVQGSDADQLAARGQPDGGDVIWGGGDDDVATGDNALVTRVAPHDELTNRIGSDGAITERRSLRLLDLSNGDGGILADPPATPGPRFGADQISGGAGVDVLFGQDGGDFISGGAEDDYAEGNGGGDQMWGDISLAAASVPVPGVAWPGTPSVDVEGDPPVETGQLNGISMTHGQDDFMGGSSRKGFRDGGDVIKGNGAADFILGDNGTVRRIIDDEGGVLTDRTYTRRYGPVTPPDAAKIRIADPNVKQTRFCEVVNGVPTCELAGAYGADQLHGEAGDDTMYGQDADDLLYGGEHDDDMYGELGNDELFGEGGDDAILGDRGGIVDQYEDGSREVNLAYNQVPRIVYDGFQAGTVTRIVDQQHDVSGDRFVDNEGAPIEDQSVPPAKMPFDGITFGGNDRIRGGLGHDTIHGGVGDDLANGDSGGDILFGNDGADLLWGGKGCDPTVDSEEAAPDCWSGGVFNKDARGDGDRMVDYLLGGKGAVSGPSVHPTDGALGSDLLDWAPRGSYVPGDESKCTAKPWPVNTGKGKTATSIDPCAWFEMTGMADANDTPELIADNQHHQGIDWQYGGWDRDILQADVADNGPNPGDRLLDWAGAYNLYTHCNSAYGGFNDVRQFSPDMQRFLQTWVWTLGAGQVLGDVTDSSTSAFNDLALVYQADIKTNGSGTAFPTTPGHFDKPNACAP